MNSRVGRPRQPGARFPSGKLKPAGDPIQPALWQRVRSDVAKLAGDVRLSSEIGRLSFHRELTDTQASAAFRVGAIYAVHERDHGKNRAIASPTFQRGAGGGRELDDAPFSDQAFNDLQDEIAVIALNIAWPAESGCRWTRNRPSDHRLRALLEMLCVDDRAVDPRYLGIVRLALDDLAGAFGVSKSRKRLHERKPPRAARREMDTPTPTPVPRQPPAADKTAYLALLAHLRTDLDEAGREQSWEIFQAMKDRERFNGEKKRRP